MEGGLRALRAGSRVDMSHVGSGTLGHGIMVDQLGDVELELERKAEKDVRESRRSQ